MIHPTRTNLLLLKEKALSVAKSMGILKARRQALMKEFMKTTVPFLKSREEIRGMFGRALNELSMSLGKEGREKIDSLAASSKREMKVEVLVRSTWGLRYKDIVSKESPVRSPDERGYDFSLTTIHLEECTFLFEKIIESMIHIAAFESKMKRLAEEITKTTRRIRILEEKKLPELRLQIRTIAQYISEREREAHFRLKKFKETALERG